VHFFTFGILIGAFWRSKKKIMSIKGRLNKFHFLRNTWVELEPGIRIGMHLLSRPPGKVSI